MSRVVARSLDLSKVVRRKMEVNAAELTSLFHTTRTGPAPVARSITSQVAPASAVIDDGREAVASPSIKRAVKGEHGELIWGPGVPLPPALSGLVADLRVLFEEETRECAVTVWPLRSKGSKTYLIQPPPLQSGVKNRYLLTAGGKEVYTYLPRTGVTGINESVSIGTLGAFPGDIVQYPTPLAYQIGFRFEDRGVTKLPPRPGFREVKFIKDPSTVHVVLIDFLDLAGTMAVLGKEAATKLAGDSKLASTAKQRVADLMGKLNSGAVDSAEVSATLEQIRSIDDLDSVIAQAGGADAIRAASQAASEEEVPMLVPDVAPKESAV